MIDARASCDCTPIPEREWNKVVCKQLRNEVLIYKHNNNNNNNPCWHPA